MALERDAVFVELLLEGERVSDGDDVVRPRCKEETGRRVGIDKVDGRREPLHALIGSFGGEHGIAEDGGSRFVCCDGRGACGEMPARREADDGDALFVDAPFFRMGEDGLHRLFVVRKGRGPGLDVMQAVAEHEGVEARRRKREGDGLRLTVGTHVVSAARDDEDGGSDVEVGVFGAPVIEIAGEPDVLRFVEGEYLLHDVLLLLFSDIIMHFSCARKTSSRFLGTLPKKRSLGRGRGLAAARFAGWRLRALAGSMRRGLNGVISGGVWQRARRPPYNG